MTFLNHGYPNIGDTLNFQRHHQARHQLLSTEKAWKFTQYQLIKVSIIESHLKWLFSTSYQLRWMSKFSNILAIIFQQIEHNSDMHTLIVQMFHQKCKWNPIVDFQFDEFQYKSCQWQTHWRPHFTISLWGRQQGWLSCHWTAFID